MKQRITHTDIESLSQKQMANLRRIWNPRLYEIAVASICVNVETDEYVDIEFCIGAVHMRPDGGIMLKDLRAVGGVSRIEHDEEIEAISFSKDSCLPLLSIGEMIEIMDDLSFRNFHFYLLAGTGVTGCEVGHFRSALKDKILTEGYQSAELCDVLWNMIVAQL